MQCVTADEAVTLIIANVQSIRDEPAEDAALTMYANKFVGFVLDYCNREDFPKTLIYTATDYISQWLEDKANGGRQGALKSLEQNDTKFQFAVSDMTQSGSQTDADLQSFTEPILRRIEKSGGPYDDAMEPMQESAHEIHV